jgi:hypothetical protein
MLTKLPPHSRPLITPLPKEKVLSLCRIGAERGVAWRGGGRSVRGKKIRDVPLLLQISHTVRHGAFHTIAFWF